MSNNICFDKLMNEQMMNAADALHKNIIHSSTVSGGKRHGNNAILHTKKAQKNAVTKARNG